MTSCSYYNLPTKIETRTEYEFFYKSKHDNQKSAWRKTRKLKGYSQYDKNGNIIKRVVYGDFYQIVHDTNNFENSFITQTHNLKDYHSAYLYYYDNHNKLDSIEQWQYANNEKLYLVYRTCIEYNSVGKRKSKTIFESNNTIHNIVKYICYQDYLKYSNVSSFISNLENSPNDEDKRGYIVVLDSLERPLVEIDFFAGSFISSIIHRYDFLGETETILLYIGMPDNPNNLAVIEKLQYNSDRQLIRRVNCTLNNIETEDKYEYNHKNLLVKILHYSGKELEGYTKYKYTLY